MKSSSLTLFSLLLSIFVLSLTLRITGAFAAMPINITPVPFFLTPTGSPVFGDTPILVSYPTELPSLPASATFVVQQKGIPHPASFPATITPAPDGQRVYLSFTLPGASYSNSLLSISCSGTDNDGLPFDVLGPVFVVNHTVTP